MWRVVLPILSGQKRVVRAVVVEPVDVAGRLRRAAGAGPADGRYVRQVLTQGQGKPIPLAGRADLEVVVRDFASASAYTPRHPAHVVDVRGFPALRQVAWGGSFEGYTTLGVGVRTRLPIHVFVLPGPGRDSRLVIDVAQHR